MKKFDFSKGFGNIDPKYISEAEGEWKEKKNVWIASFWSKLAAACVILALISTVLSNPKVQAAIKNLALSIGETLGFQKEIEPYTEALNISQTDHGITANIKEVVLDEGVLPISSVIPVFLKDEIFAVFFFSFSSVLSNPKVQAAIKILLYL